MKRSNLWKCALKRCLMLMLTLALLAGAALGEPVRGDLTERFASIPRLEYEGETYYLRERVSTVMLAGILPDEEDGELRTDFVALIAIDDNEKRITPIYIDGQTITEVEGESVPLREVYALGEEPKENCLRMVDAVNGILGSELIEDYMAVDLDSITALPEFSSLEGDTRQRLHMLRVILEAIPSKQLNEMYGTLSAYLVTDMKSGAVMRVIDKADRYEIAEKVDLPVLPTEEEGAPLMPDAEQILEFVVGVFYKTELY